MSSDAAAKTVLLIHGAWQGSWVWKDFAPRLSQEGFIVEAVDLPGNGQDNMAPADVSLDLYIRFLCDCVDRLGGPLVLIGHSGGGVLASQLAERRCDQIAGVVYLAGMLLPSGMLYAELVRTVFAEPLTVGVAPHLVWSEDRRTTTVPTEAAADIFLQDMDRLEALQAARQLTPQGEGGRAISALLTPERFGTIPRLYVEALNDRSLPLAIQRRMQALTPGSDVVSVPTGHAPHVVAPAMTVAAILPWLNSLRRTGQTNSAS